VAADSARDPDPAKRPIVPVENITPPGAARVRSKVTAQQIVVHLRAHGARTLARQAQAGRDVAADVYRRQEGVQVLQVKMDHSTLHDRTGGGVDRVLGIAGPKTVHVPAHLDFIQTVVDAVKDAGAPTTQHHLTVGPADGILPALKQRAQVSLDTEADAPRLVRRCDVHTVTGSIAETRQ